MLVHCYAMGDPRPSVSWYKNNQMLPVLGANGRIKVGSSVVVRCLLVGCSLVSCLGVSCLLVSFFIVGRLFVGGL